MRKAILTAGLMLFTAAGLAQDVDFEGYGAFGFIHYSREILGENNNYTYYEGKLQAEFEYNKHIEGQLDFRAHSVSNTVELREFSLKVTYFDYVHFKFGNLKKPFGIEELMTRDDLYTVDRSLLNEEVSEIGYGARSISLQCYYEYDDDQPEFPFTYFLSAFKDNSQYYGGTARLRWHHQDFSFGGSYSLQYKSYEEEILFQGFGVDAAYESDCFHGFLEANYVQDPVEGVRRRLNGLDETVFATGVKLLATYQVKVKRKFCHRLEPLLLVSYYTPDNSIGERHTIQTLIGFNYYLHKKVRVMINGDLRFTKNPFNDGYTTDESRFIAQIQARF